MKENITLFWFKRDLRLEDNDALNSALTSSNRLLMVYILEPSLESDPHYDIRHFQFIKESISDLNERLSKYDTQVLCIRGEVIEVFDQIQTTFTIESIYSSLESGLQVTFNRDKQVINFCDQHQITWHEFRQNPVKRGIKNRIGWREEMYAFLTAPILPSDIEEAAFFSLEELKTLELQFDLFSLHTPHHPFQVGGRTEGKLWEESFFNERLKFYTDYISKPLKSRTGCSRLSPYFAWGCISIREVFQRAMKIKASSSYKKQLTAFTSRLKWQSHFIQKFESEIRMEKEPVNRSFTEIRQPVNEAYIKAWKTGTTGYPLVDASIRCVIETGYLNFRMRTMITSFLTHHLFQPFTTGSAWLARQFLDFEPGIHYGQFQMQAGLTGINTVRVYNPTRNATEHDPDAEFIKRYLPELRELPAMFAIEPWKMTLMEGSMYQFEYGKSYPKRIVDINETRKVALESLYGQRKTALAQREIQRILDRHTLHITENRFP